jgi:hypothetical protein
MMSTCFPWYFPWAAADGASGHPPAARRLTGAVSALATLILASCLPALAQTELLVNGGFESGTFAGWTLNNRPLGDAYDPDVAAAGDFVPEDSDAVAPLTGLPTLGPASGSFFALSDMTAQGTHTLRQSFTVPLTATAVTLSFDMYVYDWFGAGAAIDASGLDHTTGGTNQPNQHARVDLLSSASGAFDTDGSGVVQNLYLGVDPEAAQAPPEAPLYRSYSFDLTSVALPGQTYQLRFGTVDNQFVIHQAVDNVSVLANAPVASAAPEPDSLILSAFGLLLALLRIRSRPGGLSFCYHRQSDSSALPGSKAGVSAAAERSK